MNSLQRPILCAVTDRRALGHRPLIGWIRDAALSGVDLIQLREPDLGAAELLALARAAVDAARGTSARVVVNDRLDVALAARAAGVHLRGDSIPAARVRGVVPDGFIIGRSVHAAEEALAVEAQGGCDYLVFGTVFPSASKPRGHQAAGLAVLGSVCAAVRVPVLAIGGVSIARAAEAATAGAAGVAGIGLFLSPTDLPETVRALRRAFDT